MKDFYERSIAPLGTEDWSEPHDVTAVTPEIAAREVLQSHAEVHQLDPQQEVGVCVRQVNLEGDPLGEWHYFRGKAWIVWRSEVTPYIPDPETP